MISPHSTRRSSGTSRASHGLTPTMAGAAWGVSRLTGGSLRNLREMPELLRNSLDWPEPLDLIAYTGLAGEVSTYHETKPRVSSASFTRLSDLTPEATEWLWHLRIPK